MVPVVFGGGRELCKPTGAAFIGLVPFDEPLSFLDMPCSSQECISFRY